MKKTKLVSIIGLIILVSAFVGASFVWSREKAHPKFTYYFLLSTEESASVLVLDYERGGTGILYQGKGILQICPDEEKAKEVSDRLKERGKDTLVVEVRSGACEKGKGWHETMRTIDSVVWVCYRLANGLERGEITQSQARGVVNDTLLVLNGCKTTSDLKDLIEEIETSLNTEYYQANQIRKAMASLCLAIL